jgi:hypothetical protein
MVLRPESPAAAAQQSGSRWRGADSSSTTRGSSAPKQPVPLLAAVSQLTQLQYLHLNDLKVPATHEDEDSSDDFSDDETDELDAAGLSQVHCTDVGLASLTACSQLTALHLGIGISRADIHDLLGPGVCLTQLNTLQLRFTDFDHCLQYLRHDVEPTFMQRYKSPQHLGRMLVCCPALRELQLLDIMCRE